MVTATAKWQINTIIGAEGGRLKLPKVLLVTGFTEWLNP